MKNCSKCGHNLTNLDVKFCPHCGKNTQVNTKRSILILFILVSFLLFFFISLITGTATKSATRNISNTDTTKNITKK